MPGRLPLTRVAVPAFSCASRARRAVAMLMPARAAMTATAAPAGSADSAARTAPAGLWPAAGATGAGAGVVAVSAALRAACGTGFFVRAMMVTPFLFSGAIPVF
jgi:NAD/NADP transhydrogenase alpha subunit